MRIRVNGFSGRPNLLSSMAAHVSPAGPSFGHPREVVSYVARRHKLRAVDLQLEPGRAFARHPHREAVIEVVRICLDREFRKTEIAGVLHAGPHFISQFKSRWLA